MASSSDSAGAPRPGLGGFGGLGGRGRRGGRRRGARAGQSEAPAGDSSDDEPRAGLGDGLLASLGFGGGRRRKQSDEHVLGVFAEGEDSPPERSGSRKKGGGKGAALASPVAFVQGETVNKQEVPAPKEDTKSDDEEIDPRFRFDGAPNAPPAPEHGPKLPARNKLSMGQMENNYGKGFAMLKKMGFQGGGLGARNDGIANPIEVMKRRERQGLQEDGEMVNQDLFGQENAADRRTVEELLSGPSRKKKKEGPQRGEGWKRDGKAKKPRTVYKTAAELASEPKKMRIVDMRGPEIRVVQSFSELADQIRGDSVNSLRELRHNTRRLVVQYEEKIRALAEKKKYYEDILLSVADEQERLSAAKSIGDCDAKRCRETALEIEQLREQHSLGTIGFRELGDAFCALRAKRPAEFDALRILDVASAFAAAAAQRAFASWRPLERPEEGLALLVPWRRLMEGQGVPNNAAGARAAAALGDSVMVPRLRAALCGWSPRDFEPCLQLVEHCQEALPRETVDAVCEQLVLPRLRMEIDSWDPRVDQTCPHAWIHPWLPLLGRRIECLWTPIRFKLSACLERWEPSDHSAHAMLRPWMLVFDPANWEPLAEKVLVKLERSVASMSVRPDGQDVRPIQDLLLWRDLLPPGSLVRVLELAFFPHWQAALREWLRSPACDYGEVLRWYSGWKELFPDALREQCAVQRQMAQGLAVMKHFMAGGGAEEFAVGAAASPPASPPRASPTRSAERGTPRGAHSAEEDASTLRAAAEDVSMSLSDYLADVAGEEGLVFRPKKVQHLGKQVYQLGAASICLDRNMVYVAPKSGDAAWKLASLDEVLALARAGNRNGSTAGTRRLA